MTPIRHACLLLLFTCLATSLLAQDMPPTEDVEHESKAETITKCLAQIGDDEPEIRRRAVLILSKYPEEPLAVAGIRSALRDPQDTVRQAAVVSLVENDLIKQNADHLLPMIGDDNVHIRRTVSTFLRFIIYSPPYLGQNFPPRIRQLLRQAVRDPDPLVRKNMLTHFGALERVLDIRLILPLFEDPNPDIRRLALTAAWEYLRRDPTAFAKRAATLVDDPDRDVRYQLAKLLGDLRSNEAADLLQKLTQDPNQEVATEARLALLSFGETDQWDHLRAILDEHRLDAKTAEHIIRGATRLNDDGAALLDLIQHAKPIYRATAIRQYSLYYRHKLQAEAIWTALDDEFSPVRQEATRLLAAAPPERLPGDLADRLMDLVRHPYADVRSFAVDLIQQVPDAQRQAPLLEEFLLDDVPGIRAKAAAQLIRRRLGDWQQIARLATEDESKLVRYAAIDALAVMKTQPHRELLQAIKLATQDRELLDYINQKTR